jgi:hypothetical protein
MSATNFEPGDILDVGGETYQVVENPGEHGTVIPFPGDSLRGSELLWDAGCRRIGNAPLPAPTPCSTDGCCPTAGNPLTEKEVFPER